MGLREANTHAEPRQAPTEPRRVTRTRHGHWWLCSKDATVDRRADRHTDYSCGHSVPKALDKNIECILKSVLSSTRPYVPSFYWCQCQSDQDASFLCHWLMVWPCATMPGEPRSPSDSGFHYCTPYDIKAPCERSLSLWQPSSLPTAEVNRILLWSLLSVLPLASTYLIHHLWPGWNQAS